MSQKEKWNSRSICYLLLYFGFLVLTLHIIRDSPYWNGKAPVPPVCSLSVRGSFVYILYIVIGQFFSKCSLTYILTFHTICSVSYELCCIAGGLISYWQIFWVCCQELSVGLHWGQRVDHIAEWSGNEFHLEPLLSALSCVVPPSCW